MTNAPWRFRATAWAAVVAMLLPSLPAWAQDEPSSDESTEEGSDDEFLIPIAEEEGEIDALKTRIRALEEQLDALQAEDQVEAQELPIDLETRINGYADLNLELNAPLSDEVFGEQDVLEAFNVSHPLGFEIGDLILSYKANLDRKVFATVDVIYGQGQFGDRVVFVDRLQFDFELSKKFRVTAGKIYSPFGYWNTNIPYGSYLYATTGRPVMMTFERNGAFITTRQTGIDLNGVFSPGFWQIGYHAGIGNGRSSRLARTADVGDATQYKTTWLQAYVESPGGIQVGATVGYDPLRQDRPTQDFNQDPGDQSDKIADTENAIQDPVLSSNVDEILIHPHVAILRPRMQLIAELALLLHKDEPDEDAIASRAAYVQWSHEFGRGTTPYARVDIVEWWKDSPVFIDMFKLKVRRQATIGLRREIALHAALKFEATLIDETIFRHPADDLFVEPGDSLFQEGINEELSTRVGGQVQLAVGF